MVNLSQTMKVEIKSDSIQLNWINFDLIKSNLTQFLSNILNLSHEKMFKKKIETKSESRLDWINFDLIKSNFTQFLSNTL